MPRSDLTYEWKISEDLFLFMMKVPLLNIDNYYRWFFAMISISGIFAVTFSVVFAYVADVTTTEDRSKAYGLVGMY